MDAAQLDKPFPNRAAADARWEYLSERPLKHREDDFLFVHGSPRNPLNEYIFPEDIYSEAKMRSIFAQVPRYMFQGHTHVPGIFTESLEFLSSDELDADTGYKLDGRKMLCNVGSVGQPRDGDCAGLLRSARRYDDSLPPRRVRCRDDYPQDPRHRRAGRLPRRAAAWRPLGANIQSGQKDPFSTCNVFRGWSRYE